MSRFPWLTVYWAINCRNNWSKKRQRWTTSFFSGELLVLNCQITFVLKNISKNRTISQKTYIPRAAENWFLVMWTFAAFECNWFLPRSMECRHGLSVCPSVCLSNAWIVTKRKKNLSKFLYHTKGHLA